MIGNIMKYPIVKAVYRFIIKYLSFIPDEPYLRIIYWIRVRKHLDIKNPRTFNEKMQWLKINDRKPQYTNMVDKAESKKIVAQILGEQYIIPTLGVWERFDDIDFDKLPQQFVLKCTHDSGGLIICKDKNELDLDRIKKQLEKSLKSNFYYGKREWPYKNVSPRIMAEEYMQDREYKFLPVYKFFCFNGEPKIIQTIQNDKQENESVDYFDREWKLLQFRQNYPNSETPLNQPDKLDEMLDIARKLSVGRSFIRIDLYLVNGNIKFSEYTFYSDSGMARFYPECWDNILGEWIELPHK